MDETTTAETTTFTRRERGHLAALHKRLEWIRAREPEDASEDYQQYYGLFPGEAAAIQWALATITGIEPLELRLARFDDRLRRLEHKVGRLQKDITEWEEDDA